MKKALVLFYAICTAVLSQAQVSKIVNLNAVGTLATVLTADELATVTDLTVAGPMNGNDLNVIRDKMPLLSSLNMLNASALNNGLSYFSFWNSSTGKGNISLTSIILPSNFVAIRQAMFYGCSNLQFINIPSTVTSIEASAFAGCTSLSTVKLPNGITKIDNDVFSGCSNLTQLTIPESVTAIGTRAFSKCTSLHSIKIPDAVISIGDNAFDGCSKFETLDIPGNVEKIGSLGNISGLKDLTIPASVTSLGTFRYTTSLTSIIVDTANRTYKSIDGVLYTKDGSRLLEWPRSKIGTCSIPNTLTEIQAYAFQNCTGLTQIDIPNSVVKIGDLAFTNCINLDTLFIPASVTSLQSGTDGGATQGVGGYIVVDKNNPTFESLDGVLYTKGRSWLISCPGSVKGKFTFPTTVSMTSNYAFSNCNQLTNVHIPSTFTLGAYSAPLFSGCGATSYTVDADNPTYSSVDGVLYSKDKKTLIKLPAAIDGIFTVPFSVTTIGRDALSNGSLTGLKVLCPPTALTNQGVDYWYNQFANTDISKICTLYVPTGCKQAYTNAVGWQAFTTIVEMPDVLYIQCSAGKLSTLLTTDQKNTVTRLYITGSLDARDFAFMRDFMPLLKDIDLSSATVSSYTGTAGTRGVTTFTYPSYTIPYSAFEKNANLNSIVLPANTTTIDSSAFMSCTKLTTVSISSNVTVIRARAFSFCNALSNISLPVSLTVIEDRAFNYCTSIISVKMPPKVTAIGGGAFYSCAKLRYMEIPASVVSIQTLAFAECIMLDTIRVLNPVPVNLTTISDVFLNVNYSTCKLLVPEATFSAYLMADQWKSFLYTRPIYCEPEKSLIEIPATSAIQISFSVNTNTIWSATDDATWLSYNITRDKIIFFATNNTSVKKRSAIVTITGAGATTKTLTVEQSGADTLLSSSLIDVRVGFSTNSSTAIDVASTTEWTATTTSDWLTISPSLPITGNSSLVFTTIASNTSIIPRTAEVLITATGADDLIINVVQDGVARYVNATTTTDLHHLADTAIVSVTSNTKWKVAAEADWLNVIQVADSADADFKVAATVNPTIIPRYASVVVSATGADSVRLAFVQAAGDTIVSLDKNAISVLGGADTATVAVASNTRWSAMSDAEWVKVSVPNDSADAEMTVVVSANPDITPRSAQVRFSATGADIQTLTVNQAAGDTTLSAYTTRADLTGTADTVLVSVKSNTKWQVASSADWLALSVQTDSADAFFIIMAMANPTIISRNAYITFSAAGAATDTIEFAQAAGDTVLTVSSNTIQMSAKADTSASVLVASNTSWTVSSSSPWLTYRSASDSSNAEIEIVANENKTISERSGEIRITAIGAAEQVVRVTQSAGDAFFAIPATASVSSKTDTAVSLPVLTNISWTAVCAEDWVILDPKDGESLVVSASPNSSATPRTAKIICLAGTIQKVVTLVQSGDTLLVVNPLSASIDKSMSTVDVTVASNTAWAVSSVDSWIKPSLSGSVNNGAFTINIEANPTVYARTGYMSVTAGTVVRTIMVEQAAGDTIFGVETTAVAILAKKDTSATVNISSNINFALVNPAEWLTATVSMDKSHIQLNALPNNSTEPRSVVIQLISDNVTRSFTISQAGDTTLMVATKNISLPSQGGGALFDILSNTAWRVQSNASWLTISSDKGTGNFPLSVFATENKTVNIRTAHLVISATGAEDQVVEVAQATGDSTMSVSAAEIRFDATKDSTDIIVTSNFSWTASSSADWVTAVIIGDTIRLTTNTNVATTSRTTKINIMASSKIYRTITLTQDAGSATLSALASITIAADTDQGVSIPVSSNTDWSAVTTADWLVMSQKEGTGNGEILFIAGINTSSAPRTAIILVSANGAKAVSVTVTQAGGYVSDDETLVNQIAIYPNPAKQSFSLTGTEVAEIYIRNIAGDYVHDQPISAGEKVHIDFLSSGIYTVTVMYAGGTQNIRLVKE